MENVDDSFFEVQVSSSPLYITEQDEHARRCAALASEFRERPTLPADPGDPNVSFTDVASGVRFPLYACAFRGCLWQGADKGGLESHLASAHGDRIQEVCGGAFGHLDYYQEAIAWLERSRIPAVGASVDRRTLSLLAQDYNDEKIRNLICFVCGQSKTTMPGGKSPIEYKKRAWLALLGEDVLQANLSWDTW